MTEQYGFKFVVDASDAAKGWKQFETAVEGVFGSLDKMERHVAKTMDAVNKATKGSKTNITAFTKAANELGRIKVNPTAARNVQTLSNAMKSFKAPSATQVKNTQAFFRALEKSGVGGGAAAGRNIATLSAAMNGFKAPSATNVTNLRALFAALAAYPSGKNFTNAAGLMGTLRQLQGFKAPSSAQIKNLQNFLNTVANLKIPQNGAQIARVLEQISRASNGAAVNLRGLRGSVGSMPWQRFNSGAQGARLQMMGLQNAFSGTYQIGSALRTLLGTLTIGELARSYFEATNAALQFNAQMSVINKEAPFAALQLDYVNTMANRFGVDALAAANGFAKISIAADKSGIAVGQTRHIFEGMSTAMSVLGISTAGQGDVWLALQQVMNKGYLSAEELNQQLNEKLPGAMAYATEYAESLGLTLEKGLKTKALDAAGVLEHISRRMKEDFGPAVSAALERPAAQMNILKNNFTLLFQAIGENGGNQAVADLLKSINAQMTPEKIEQYAIAIGEGLKNAVDKVAGAFQWLHDNWDSIKGPLSATLDLMGRWMIVSSALQIGKFIVQPLMMVSGAVGGLRAAGAAVTQLMTVARAGSLMGMITAAQGLSGASAVVATRMIALRNAIVMMTISSRTATASSGLLAAALRSIGAGAAMAITGLRGLYAALGGPILALGVMAYAAYKLYDGISSGNDVLRAHNDTLRDNAKAFDDASASIFVTSQRTDTATGMTAALTGGVAIANDFLSQYKAKLDEATGGLYSMAAAAQEAAIKTAELARQRQAAHLAKLVMQDPGSLIKAGDQIGNDKSRGFLNRKFMQGTAYMAAGIEKFQGAVGLNEYSPEVVKSQVEEARGLLARMNAGIKDLKSANTMDIANEMKNRGYAGAGPRESSLSGDGSDKKTPKARKGPKGPDPMAELDKLQRKADQVMNRLTENNPLLAVQRDFINATTENAQTLLSDAGYMAYMEALKDNTDGVIGSLALLDKALLAGGADQALLNDLQARYGIGMDEITDMISQQEDAYKRANEEAAKQMDFAGPIKKKMAEELQFAMMSTDQAAIMTTLQERILFFKEKGWKIDQGVLNTLEDQIRQQQQRVKLLDAEREFYENNGLNNFISEVRTAGEAVHDLDYNVLGSLKDQLVSLGTTGKFSFGAIFDSIQSGLVSFAAEGITSKIGSMLSNGDSQNPTIFGGLFDMMGFNTGFDQTTANQRINAARVELYATSVNANGDILSGGLGSLFSHTKNGLGNGLDESGQILASNAAGIRGPQDLTDILTQPMTSAVNEVGDAMNSEWGQQITGLGSLFSSLAQGIFGNGSAGSGIFNSLLSIGGSALGIGAFKEGGFSTSPVAWAKAPHYAEGTANTSGGIPAVLHDNEAVIPLSRGRKVPVEVNSNLTSGGRQVINNNFNVTSPDADSFRNSRQQIITRMHMDASRSYRRNRS